MRNQSNYYTLLSFCGAWRGVIGAESFGICWVVPFGCQMIRPVCSRRKRALCPTRSCVELMMLLGSSALVEPPQAPTQNAQS
eukprot:5513203-Amphidinium_carterae.1